jgi:hypothetical protein
MRGEEKGEELDVVRKTWVKESLRVLSIFEGCLFEI